MKKKNSTRIIASILVVALILTFVIAAIPLQGFQSLNRTENTEYTMETETADTQNNTEVKNEEVVENEETPEVVSMEELKSEKKIANIKLTTGENIKIALYPKIAPISVENFVNLVNEKFYDGIVFHRVVKDFMIQTGDPTATGTGGSDKTIKGEFKSNGVENPLSHTKGIVSMARATDKNSASSQFFITVADATFLDGEYAAFGEVLEGQEVADKISLLETDASEKPFEEVKIETITIEE